MPPKPRPKGPPKRAKAKAPPPPSTGPDRRVLTAMAGAAGVVLLALGLGYVLFGGGDAAAKEAPKLLEAAGCTLQSVKALPSNDHSVTKPTDTSTKWNTSPPTNGPHNSTPAIFGAYTTPLNQAQVVHNLEHGGVFIQYGKDVPQATVDSLKAFYDQHPTGTLLAPLPSLGSTIALGAWTTRSTSSPDDGTAYLAKCSTFDEKAYSTFLSAYQFKGPERFSESRLGPGS